VPAPVSFVDIAGLVRGASKGQGRGNAFLANIREASAICQVVRAFSDPNVVHVDGKVSPARRHRDDQHRADPGRPADARQGAAAAGEGGQGPQGPRAGRGRGAAARHLSTVARRCTPAQRRPVSTWTALRELTLLTTKPFLYVFNVDEAELAAPAFLDEMRALVAPAEAIFLDAKVESELIDLPEDEARELLESIGQPEPWLHQLIKVGFGRSGCRPT
jgi:ribosome-binding ATPase YchF (GTP1/OBG family)